MLQNKSKKAIFMLTKAPKSNFLNDLRNFDNLGVVIPTCFVFTRGFSPPWYTANNFLLNNIYLPNLNANLNCTLRKMVSTRVRASKFIRPEKWSTRCCLTKNYQPKIFIQEQRKFNKTWSLFACFPLFLFTFLLSLKQLMCQ